MQEQVCSTHVEMFLILFPPIIQTPGLLHACGDVSFRKPLDIRLAWFAPRMWRCFHGRRHGQDAGWVCSTHVEMFLTSFLPPDSLFSLLHACGDVSGSDNTIQISDSFAPRMWRCFWPYPALVWREEVCSTHVEMFLFEADLF